MPQFRTVPNNDWEPVPDGGLDEWRSTTAVPPAAAVGNPIFRNLTFRNRFQMSRNEHITFDHVDFDVIKYFGRFGRKRLMVPATSSISLAPASGFDWREAIAGRDQNL